MQYINHYLSDVIFRIDFVSPEESLKQSLSSEVKNACVKYFAIPETRQVETQQVIVTNNPGVQNTVINKEQLSEWHFFGTEKEKELCITNTCMFVDIKRYLSFDDLKQQFFDILDALIKAYPAIRINRVGLRYINTIDLPAEKKARKSWHNYWSKYINEALIKGLSFPDEDGALSRQMNSTEMNYSDHMLRFQYGIYNADYPAPIKKNVFVLDTDVYAVGLIDIDDLKTYADRFHEHIISWFERAIKAELKDKMGVRK